MSAITIEQRENETISLKSLEREQICLAREEVKEKMIVQTIVEVD